ncbi:MAG: IMP dehydrogenase [Candidatus Mcinerneyibacterium aminivorans]|uniref:Inosine-5'-monophosphate dehydrogenase n=1 Tax=Candidatus Mcinerneyibacterium aminivorans TaxID=2703815 RepID=A0A5D0MDS0_9BACT|nr:MAG: IMP dehydrogenase [Candidatus Mcinerneyibacterium aminivorans]
MNDKITSEGLTFDDILMIPKYSDVKLHDIDLSTQLTRNLNLKIPIISAAMDTVTEANMAIAMAIEGGLGIIHYNMSPEEQAIEVDKVKRYESGMITNPITLRPDEKVSKAKEFMSKHDISGIPITIGQKLKGIITKRDLRFATQMNQKIKQVMTPEEKLITVPENTSMNEAIKKLHKHRIEKLLVVDNDFNLKGLITVKDIQKNIDHPLACKDKQGRLKTGAAVGVLDDAMERVPKLIEAGVDLIVIDSSHGFSEDVITTVKKLKNHFNIEIAAGNVATKDGAKALLDAGADAIKIGIGPGSICTTRIVAGVGVPQVSAILNVMKYVKDTDVPVIADGGIRYSGDIVKAIGVGANTVMLGSLLAGTDESPGELVIYKGRSFKTYRGMGSLGAMKRGSKERYFQEDIQEESKFVPEGIEGRVPYKGKLKDTIYQLLGGLKSGMGHCGAHSIKELRTDAEFTKITVSSLKESHPHDVNITKEAPNYRFD